MEILELNPFQQQNYKIIYRALGMRLYCRVSESLIFITDARNFINPSTQDMLKNQFNVI